MLFLLEMLKLQTYRIVGWDRRGGAREKRAGGRRREDGKQDS